MFPVAFFEPILHILEKLKSNLSYVYEAFSPNSAISFLYSFLLSSLLPLSITKIQYKSNTTNKDCYPYMKKEQKEDEQYSM